jgi:hypothetical protein
MSHVDADKEPWTAVGLVPASPGAMDVDLARIKRIEEWSKRYLTNDFVEGFWPSPLVARAGLRRIRIMTIYDADAPLNYVYAELHADGAAFAARRVPHEPEATRRPRILNESLVWTMASCLRLVGAHSVETVGCFGEAATEVRLIGPEMELCYSVHGFLQRAEGSVPTAGPLASRHTVMLEALAGRVQALLATARPFLMDLFQAFGAPEVRQIAHDGSLRIGYFMGQAEIRRWAETGGVAITERDVA